VRLRTLVKTAAAEAAHRTGAHRLWSPSAPERALVLGYHRVVEDYRRAAARSIPPMLISVSMLERQLDWVARHFDIVSLDELGRRLERGDPGRRAPAAITFDDGYQDVYEHAAPLLRRKGIPAAFFVVTDLVGSDGLLLHDRLYLALARACAEPRGAALRVRPALGGLGLPVPGGDGGRALRDPFEAMRALTESVPAAALERLIRELSPALSAREFPDLRLVDWDTLRALHQDGWTIGSHTCAHALLALEDAGVVRRELETSRRRLEFEIGAPVRHLAYPAGRFSHAVVEEVAAAGYRFAYTTCRHRDRMRPLLSIPRRLLWERSCSDASGRFSPALMRGQVQGVFDLAGRCRQAHDAAPQAGIPA
jgi:peptidoglycan/xylan/chitin deacetylase (PgdA/CDA1 family)